MQRLVDTLVFSPSDLNGFLECEYLTRLDVEAAHGRVIEKRRRPEADLLAARGFAHERDHLGRLRSNGLRVLEIEEPAGEVGWAEAVRETRQAMESGADAIYQGVLSGPDVAWRGRADLLIRVDRPSALGQWSYEAWDTKLARHAKPKHVLPLAFYTEGVAAIQGREPEWMHVILGNGEEEHFRCRDYMAYYRRVRERFLRSVEAGIDATPIKVEHCGLCGYGHHCDAYRRERDHLSLVASIRRSQIERLHAVGIDTCAALASMNGVRTGIGEAALERLRQQARLQVHARTTGEHRYELLPPAEENGFRLLPRPSEGDIFFDMEGFPYFEPSGGLEYLFGVAVRADVGRVPLGEESADPADEHTFLAFRASSRAEEKEAFEDFVDFVWERLRRWPDLHVYHYAHYEPASLKRLMSVHATREDEVDELLRREVFVDLYQVVRRSVRISHENYSIKSVRRFFMPAAGQGQVGSGADSILEYQRYLDTGDETILDAIEHYNEEDCVSTLRLRDWLLERKEEAERQFGVELPFLPANARREKQVEPEPEEHAELKARLLSYGGRVPPQYVGRVPRDDGARGPADDGPGPVLRHLLDYHRREAKPEWWAYFERTKKSLDELLEDTEAIAYLTPTDDPTVEVRKSVIHTLAFPDQEFKLKPDTVVEGPLGAGAVGTIEWIDAARGKLGLRRGVKRKDDPLPAAVIAAGPLDDKAQRRAIVRIAESLVAGDEGQFAAILDILERRPPRIRGLGPGTPIQTLDLEAQKRLVADLDDSYLFIQGPPGSGKTWTGARLIVSLLANGKRVGVTASNHRAIHNLLEEVERVAIAEGVRFSGLKKRSVSDETAYEGRFITSVVKNDDCAASGAHLLAGTAWLFADDCMEGRIDYLFIDEAGQMALADALAAATSARRVVLLGDPQQLPHVTQNTHPFVGRVPRLDPGLVGRVPRQDGSRGPADAISTGASVLEHLLAGESTVAADRGLFLAHSWRMHPDVCRFVSEHSYDGRLASAPGCERQGVSSPGLSGAGLRYIPVEHRHNAQRSPEEAQAIAREVGLLLSGGTVTDRDGVTRPLLPSDILVVAPYNMQVRCIREALRDDVEVGTVDKFQGREGAVVFFSMASSSGEDVPRGLEFLFNRNRFNVAVSRAKCLSVVICSPRLPEVRCARVEQMALVNALCRFAELAGAIGLQSRAECRWSGRGPRFDA